MDAKNPNLFYLYGPPASGKSTLLVYLALNCPDCTTIDLEALHDGADRAAFPQLLPSYRHQNLVFVGAADVSPDSLPAGSKVIALIHSDVDGYLNRVSRRDAKKARNRNQNAAEHFLGIKEYLKYHPPFLTIDPLEYEGRFDELALAVLAKAREASVKDPENA